jgi:hypothetical protein
LIWCSNILLHCQQELFLLTREAPSEALAVVSAHGHITASTLAIAVPSAHGNITASTLALALAVVSAHGHITACTLALAVWSALRHHAGSSLTDAVAFTCKQCARRIASASAVGSTGGRVGIRRQQHRFKVFDVEVADATRNHPVATLIKSLTLSIGNTIVTIICGSDVCSSRCVEEGSDDGNKFHDVQDLQRGSKMWS